MKHGLGIELPVEAEATPLKSQQDKIADMMIRQVSETVATVNTKVVPINREELALRAADDLPFYREGLSDYIRGARHTPAALGYVAYWKLQIETTH